MKTQKDITLSELQELLWDITNPRDWEDHYYPDKLAKSIVVEAADLLKEFQWKDEMQVQEFMSSESERQRLAFKTIDLLYHLLMFSEALDIDLNQYVFLKVGKKR